MFSMSINPISNLHTSWIILRKVDPVETNPYKIVFCLLLDPSAEDNVEARLSSFGVMKETSNIRLPPSPPAPFPSNCLHPNQRPSRAHLLAFVIFSHIISAPPAPSTSMLV